MGPKIIYKYMSADIAQKALSKDDSVLLRATQPASLNDVFECSTVRDSSELQEMVDALNRVCPEFPLSVSDILNAQEELGDRAWNHLFRKQLSYRLGVISFSLDNTNSLLWAHYADEHRGFAVGYDVTYIMTKVIGRNRNDKLDVVSYEDNPLSINKRDDMLLGQDDILHTILLRKSSLWKYEQEARIIVDLRNTDRTHEVDRNGYPIHLFSIPNEAVATVYCTERTPESAIEKIEERLRDMGSRFGCSIVQKLILSSNSYRYEVSPS